MRSLTRGRSGDRASGLSRNQAALSVFDHTPLGSPHPSWLARINPMRRRGFISFLSGAAVAWPFAARAQQRAVPVFGVLSSRSPAVDTSLIAVIRQGLNEAGFVEGQNVAFDYRWADGQFDRLARLAADLVHQQVAVIVAIGGELPGLAAKAATATVPIVFTTGDDPVSIGLVASLNRLGGNLTGVSLFASRLGPKRLGLLHEMVPSASRIGVVINPAMPNGEDEA
jgi:ABC-type uncharacterized transport system substrate-binding protein